MRSYLAPLFVVSRVTVVVLILLVLAGSASAGPSGLCHSVIVSSKVVLPDGSVHGPGTLTSCAERTHSPTSTLLELSVDGHPVHMVISRTGQSEAPSELSDPFFVFHRDRQDRLVLQGYVVPHSGDLLTYGMHQTRDLYKVTSTWVARAIDDDSGETNDPSEILIAAWR